MDLGPPTSAAPPSPALFCLSPLRNDAPILQQHLAGAQAVLSPNPPIRVAFARFYCPAGAEPEFMGSGPISAAVVPSSNLRFWRPNPACRGVSSVTGADIGAPQNNPSYSFRLNVIWGSRSGDTSLQQHYLARRKVLYRLHACLYEGGTDGRASFADILIF